MNKSAFRIVISLIMAMAFALCSCFIAGHAAANMGDVNADGKINSADALLVLKFSTQLQSPTSAQKKLADVNGDGKIDSSDALEILKYSTGISSAFIKTTTTTTTTTTTAKPTTAPASSGIPVPSGANCSESFEQECKTEINRIRSSNGVRSANYDMNMAKLAAIRAKEISYNFSHTRPGGKKSYSIYEEYGVA